MVASTTHNPINVNETGKDNIDDLVWTETTANGEDDLARRRIFMDWISDSFLNTVIGIFGKTTQVDQSWTSSLTEACSNSTALELDLLHAEKSEIY